MHTHRLQLYFDRYSHNKLDYTLTDSLTREIDTLNCCFDLVWDVTTEAGDD